MTSVSQSVSVAIARREHATKTNALRLYWRGAFADSGLVPLGDLDPLAVGDAMQLLGKTDNDLRRDVDQLRMATDPKGIVAAAIEQADAVHAEAQAKANAHLAKVAELKAAFEAAQRETFALQNNVLAATNLRDQAHQRRSIGEQRAAALVARDDFQQAGGWSYLEQLRQTAAVAAGGVA